MFLMAKLEAQEAPQGSPVLNLGRRNHTEVGVAFYNIISWKMNAGGVKQNREFICTHRDIANARGRMA